MAVQFASTDPPTILEEILSDFTTVTGRTLLPSQPEYLFCQSLAYRIVLEREQINATGNSQLLAFSSAPVLDYIVALLGVTRLPSAYAVTTLQFTLVAGHGPVVIPQNTRVISTDGLMVFATSSDVTVDANTLVVNVDAECQTAGAAGNGYAIGTIIQIQDVQAYLSACTNVSITAGGSDVETDNQLRSRAMNAPAQFSVAGPKNAYKYFALAVSSLIVDVAVVSYADDNTIPLGEVDIYPLLANGQLANQALIDEIQAALSDDSVRPLCDVVVVKTPTEVDYTVMVNITKYTNSQNTDILSLVNPLIIAYGATKVASLGLDIVNSEIEAMCRVAGVYDLQIVITPTAPAGRVLTGNNLVIASNEFAVLQNYSVNIIGTNNG